MTEERYYPTRRQDETRQDMMKRIRDHLETESMLPDQMTNLVDRMILIEAEIPKLKALMDRQAQSISGIVTFSEQIEVLSRAVEVIRRWSRGPRRVLIVIALFIVWPAILAAMLTIGPKAMMQWLIGMAAG